MKEGRGIEPLCTRLSNAFQKERVSGHLAIQQYTKAHSGYSLSLPHDLVYCHLIYSHSESLHSILIRGIIEKSRASNTTS